MDTLLAQKLRDLKYKSIPILRKGDTGIGYTLETHLGIKENNTALPDFKDIEIKTKQVKSTSMTTLFCYGNKSNFIIPLKQIIENCGSLDGDKIKLYSTVTAYPNNLNLYYKISQDELCIFNQDQLIMKWCLDKLNQRFKSKMPKLLVASAKKSKGFVVFDEFQLYNNSFDIKDLLDMNLISIDFRCHVINGKVRDRGIAFRTGNIQNCFAFISSI